MRLSFVRKSSLVGYCCQELFLLSLLLVVIMSENEGEGATAESTATLAVRGLASLYDRESQRKFGQQQRFR